MENKNNHIENMKFSNLIREVKANSGMHHMPEELFKCVAHVMRTLNNVCVNKEIIDICTNLINCYTEGVENQTYENMSDNYKTEGGKLIVGKKKKNSDAEIQKVSLDDDLFHEIMKLEIEAKEKTISINLKRSARDPKDFKTFQARCQVLASKLRERLADAICNYFTGAKSWNPDDTVYIYVNKYTNVYNEKFGTHFEPYISRCNYKYWLQNKKETNEN